VPAAAFATEEGAFLRGQITMEEQVNRGLTGQTGAEISPLQETQPSKPA